MSAHGTPAAEDIRVVGGLATADDLTAVLAALAALAQVTATRAPAERPAPRIPRPRLEHTLVPR